MEFQILFIIPEIYINYPVDSQKMKEKAAFTPTRTLTKKPFTGLLVLPLTSITHTHIHAQRRWLRPREKLITLRDD